MRRSVAALFKPKGKWMYDTKNVSETHRQKRLEKYESLSDQEAKSYRKREMRGKAPDDSESYWDIVPTEFRTETVMMQATGAGFNSIFEDRNPRSTAIAEDFVAARFKPPFTAKARTTAARSAQDLYADVPELAMLNEFQFQRRGSKMSPIHTSMPTTDAQRSSALHPHTGLFAQPPFPVSAKVQNPYPKSNYSPQKDPAFDTRVG